MLYGPTCLSYEHVRVMVDPSSDWDGCYAPPCVVIVGSPASWCGRSRPTSECGPSSFKEKRRGVYCLSTHSKYDLPCRAVTSPGGSPCWNPIN